MADSSGVAYHDLVPAPDTETINNPSKHETAQTLHEGPTASHALATSPTEEPGLVQLDHDEEVKDLGWNEPKEAIPAPLVGGMENEDLWVLVRRFDKVRYYRLTRDMGYLLTLFQANVPCQGVPSSCPQQPRSQHCRRG
jgi:hypothetical protein